MSNIKLANSIIGRIRQEVAKGARPEYKAALSSSLLGIPLLGGTAIRSLVGHTPVSNKAKMMSKWYDDVVMPNNAAQKAGMDEVNPYIDLLKKDLDKYETSGYANRAIGSRLKSKVLGNSIDDMSPGLTKDTMGNIRDIYEMNINSPQYAKTMFGKFMDGPISAINKQIGEDSIAYALLKGSGS